MRDGFVRVAAVVPEVRVADVTLNVESVVSAVRGAAGRGAKVIVTPELSVTGCTCGDLLWQDALVRAARYGVLEIARRTADLDALVLVGAPLAVGATLYDCAFAMAHGRVLGVVPRCHVAGHGGLDVSRHFAPGPCEVRFITLAPTDASADEAGIVSAPVPFGTNQLFACEGVPDLVVAAEVGADLCAPVPPSTLHAIAGATLVCNLGAFAAAAGRATHLRDLVRCQSARLACGYVLAGAGPGESVTDAVFSGHCLVAEGGTLLAEAAPLSGDGVAASEVDVMALAGRRRRASSCSPAPAPAPVSAPASPHSPLPSPGGHATPHVTTPFTLACERTALTRTIDAHPFVPSDADRRAERCEEVLAIQAHGLARRLAHAGAACAVVGVSGGLDSTLALLVCARAFDLLGLGRAGIVAITMPGFGTTGRTRGNAHALARALGATLREVGIEASVRQHFADIGHDESVRDVTYENAQARERTQIVMDVANQEGGLVVGTGDLSELALGWATYNGDHMSMYGVNAGVPKTLVRHLVRHVADTCGNAEVERVLSDVLDTPVSPELLPADAAGDIAQRTEDLVGPYELHDFFLYQVLRRGCAPRKVYRLACRAFVDAYEGETILAWLRTFYRRFFAQQFKRSCLPDGPAVGSVTLSPRGGLAMPSDAAVRLWLDELRDL